MHEIRKFYLLPNYQIKEDQHELGQFIDLLGLCRSLGVLPQAGGLLDQDSYFVFLLRHALACEREAAELAERRNSARQIPRLVASPPRQRYGR